MVGRPALIGHIGEHIAAEIFGIVLEHSATAKAIDGYFEAEPLKGKSVNIKWYARLEGLLDVTPQALPDYYLVLAGPRQAAISSRGMHRSWAIEHVFLFDAPALLEALNLRGVKVGIATSVTRLLWDEAEVFPTQRNGRLILSEAQRDALRLFRTDTNAS